jgi:hypothetical protein
MDNKPIVGVTETETTESVTPGVPLKELVPRDVFQNIFEKMMENMDNEDNDPFFW